MLRLAAWLRGYRRPRQGHSAVEMLNLAQQILDLRPDFDPDVITVHENRVVFEADRSYEFALDAAGWQQLPTDEDYEAIQDHLERAGCVDDFFLRRIAFHRAVPWNLDAVTSEVARAAATITRRRGRDSHTAH